MSEVDPGAATPRLQIPPNCDLLLGMECVDKATPGFTVWEMHADERLANPTGMVQGGLLAAFADSAMAASAVTYNRGRRVFAANTELHISFLKPVPTGQLRRCSARVISGGRRANFVEAEIVDGAGMLVAKASSTFLLTDR